VFGSGLLFLFLSQVITGVFLAMYYVPSADHAHTTVAYITKEVTGGSFLRSIHAYGSSAIIIVLLLHLMQTFLYGSYKGRRELVWVAGCILLTLMLGMAFTGYVVVAVMLWWRLEDPSLLGFRRAEHNISEAVALPCSV